MADMYSRTEKLIGSAGVEKIKKSKIFIAGLGGVGSWAAEAAARSGFGRITVADGDMIDQTNRNRQLYALSSTEGEKKALLAQRRIRDINPECVVTSLCIRLTPENLYEYISPDTDFLLDATDDLPVKVAMAKYCEKQGIFMVSSMGTGKKLDITRLRVTDIYKTEVCPMAKAVRALCRREGVNALKCVWSDEPVSHSSGDMPSMVFVPAAAGLLAVKTMVEYLLKE